MPYTANTPLTSATSVCRAASTPYVVSIAYTSLVRTSEHRTRSSLAQAAAKFTPSVCTHKGDLPAGSSEEGLPITNVLSMPGVARTMVEAATCSAISSISRRGAPSASDNVSSHARPARSTDTLSTISSSDSSSAEPREGVFGLAGGFFRASAAPPDPESESESESEDVAIAASDPDPEDDASPPSSSSSERSISVSTAVAFPAPFSSGPPFPARFSSSPFSVYFSSPSPRAPRRPSVFAPSSSSAPSSSLSSPSSPSSRFAAAAAAEARRDGESSSPKDSSFASRAEPIFSAPVLVPSSLPAWIRPFETPRRRSSSLISPTSFLANSRLNARAVCAKVTLPTSFVSSASLSSESKESSSSSLSSDDPSPSAPPPRSSTRTLYVRASAPAPPCERPHAVSSTVNFLTSSARRTRRRRRARLFAASTSSLNSSRRGRVITGVASFLAAAMSSSRRRGMPSVTLASPRPAKWNVFRVICVDGSPTDCAATHPTASPGTANESRNFKRIRVSNSVLDTPAARARLWLFSGTAFASFAFFSFVEEDFDFFFSDETVNSGAKYSGCVEARNASRSSANFSGRTPSVDPVARVAVKGVSGCFSFSFSFSFAPEDTRDARDFSWTVF